METRANYVLIGAFTLVTVVGLLLFGLWAAKFSSDRDWQNYKVVFDEAVTGLSIGSPVQYNGITVGSTTELNLDEDDPRKVIAHIRVNASTPVQTDTRAKLAFSSITGPTIIQLSGGSPHSPRLVDSSDDPIPTIATTPSALQNITDTANHIIARLDKLFNDRNIASVSATLTHLEQVSGDLADRENGTQALLKSAHDATRQLERTLVTTQGTIQQLDEGLVKKLPGIIAQLETTLARIDSAAGNAEGILSDNRSAIDSFANDGLGQLGPTLLELRGLINDLRMVSEKLENNPAGYLLGREAPKEFDPQ